jgi:hypothetical protein
MRERPAETWIQAGACPADSGTRRRSRRRLPVELVRKGLFPRQEDFDSVVKTTRPRPVLPRHLHPVVTATRALPEFCPGLPIPTFEKPAPHMVLPTSMNKCVIEGI